MFFGGSLTAWTGMWMQRVAVGWLAWDLTGSAFWVGLVAFADLAPAVVVSPLAGAVADRVDRLSLSVLTQIAIGAQAALIAGLTAAGWMTVGLLLALEILGGTAAAFAQPARQSLLPGVVPRADLPSSVAVNSLVFNVARFVGPALAGAVILLWGVAPAVACNALAYGFAAASLLLLRVAPEARRGHPASKSLLAEMADGIAYVARHPGLGPVLLFAALSGVLLRGLQEILPPFVERLFQGGPDSLAILTAAFGVGALASGLTLAARGRLAGTTRIAILAVAAQALATAAFVSTSAFALGVLCAAAMGAMASLHGIAVQTLVQSASDPAMRGRVLAVWGLITRAGPAAGALALGAAGEAFGMAWPVYAAALLALGVVAWGLSVGGRAAAVLERGE
ncbi:MAG: MFS transporter [Acetobacteraceae bacterium]|nr:MFS transporter [Acetobacteraceae bacterium]